MISAADLKPRTKSLVIDLVREAGIDVSDWSSSTRGVQGASTNPKYCYEWSFVEPGKVVALNLWHRGLKDVDGLVIHEGNFRKDADDLRSARGTPAWERRARKLDDALKTAWADGLTVRVIINDGKQRVKGAEDAVASQVKVRELDAEPWTLTDYDLMTGAHLLVRGIAFDRFVDQFTLPETEPTAPERRDQTVTVFVRDSKVRLTALRRARGRCECCGAEGFRRSDSAIYLETHHVVPLSEGGPDHPSNVVALCPNHHREAHYGANAGALREAFRSLLRGDG
ncbi:MAG: endonuclease [Caulobacter sp.]|nr:endonuclease [Caulobacter sp.]